MFSRYCTRKFSNNVSMVFSNVPGPKTPYTFLGKKSKRLFFFVPGLGEVGCGISVVSHASMVKIGCIADTSNIENPSEMIKIFEKNYDKLMNIKK